MDVATFSQIQFKIFVEMLNEYVEGKAESLIRLSQQYHRITMNIKDKDAYIELINFAKQMGNQIGGHLSSTQDFFYDVKMDTVFHFFQQCFTIKEQTIKSLVQALQDRINKSIQHSSKVPGTNKRHKTVKGQLRMSKRDLDQKQEEKVVCNNDALRRVTRNIGQDLKNIDYYLNLLSEDDFRSFNDGKFQFQKLMQHRKSIQNIMPSQATKQILQTANLIQNAAENAEKIFHESYLHNYLQFKTFIANCRESQELVQEFTKDMESSTKQKFVNAIVKNSDRLLTNEKNFKKLHQVSQGTQTSEVKIKMQQKMQNLLFTQKKMNEKLTAQLQILKKNNTSSANVDKGQLQKRVQKEILARKQLEGRYKILQQLYNQKSYALAKNQEKGHLFKTEVPDRCTLTNIGCQTVHEKMTPLKDTYMQTDITFYYYYENNHIGELQHKICQLQEIIKHKDYVITELKAIKTFRDNFKSKKQLYSAVIIPNRNVSEAKSLRYLRQEESEEPTRSKEDGNHMMNSIEASTKKLVTFRETNKEGQPSKDYRLKKNVKRKEKKHQTFFGFDQKIVHQDDLIQSKSQCENQFEISLKSILKLGLSSSQKINKGTQTEIQSSSSHDKQKGKQEAQKKDKRQSKEILTHRIRPSMPSTMRSPSKQKINLFQETRKSVFGHEGMTLPKVQPFDPNLPPMNRPGESLSPLSKRHTQRPKNMLKVGKMNTVRINTVSNEVVHVNNSLNFNFTGSYSGFHTKQARQSKENRNINAKPSELRPQKIKKTKLF